MRCCWEAAILRTPHWYNQTIWHMHRMWRPYTMVLLYDFRESWKCEKQFQIENTSSPLPCHDLILSLWFAVLLGIELVKKLLRTKPMLELGARLNDIPLPGCRSFPFDSKSYWECYIRHLTLTSSHQAGTCKMGPKSDTATVVNSNLMWVCNINF